MWRGSAVDMHTKSKRQAKAILLAWNAILIFEFARIIVRATDVCRAVEFLVSLIEAGSGPRRGTQC